MPISLVLADDHPIFREGLRSLLEKEGFNVVAECPDGFDAVSQSEKLRPDVVVLDFSMPRLNGVDAAREIRRVSPRSKVIMLTAHREEQYVVEALNAGVNGYVLKGEAANELAMAIQTACRGEAYLSPGISRLAVNACVLKRRGETPGEILTPRELEVLRLISEGNTTRVIAKQLNITVKTADSYRSSLMAKLDIHQAAGLVRYAVRRGLVKP